jgi:hypothetical protein
MSGNAQPVANQPTHLGGAHKPRQVTTGNRVKACASQAASQVLTGRGGHHTVRGASQNDASRGNLV